jgi:hypothetical protein
VSVNTVRLDKEYDRFWPHICLFISVEYWGYLFSGAFTGRPLDQCIRVIHDDIVDVWNFHDPDQARNPKLPKLVVMMVRDT